MSMTMGRNELRRALRNLPRTSLAPEDRQVVQRVERELRRGGPVAWPDRARIGELWDERHEGNPMEVR